MLRKLFFNLAYFWRPIWDTGISPPELVNFINNHPPGNALDLGCGSGTNVITLAKHGWKATGVDFSLRAIQIAKEKAFREGVNVDLRVGDVTRLDSIRNKFDLILDIGCFHSLPPTHQHKYINTILRLLHPDGIYLLYVFFKNKDEEFGPGITEEHLEPLTEKLKLISRQDSTERGIRPSAWLEYRKNSQ